MFWRLRFAEAPKFTKYTLRSITTLDTVQYGLSYCTRPFQEFYYLCGMDIEWKEPETDVDVVSHRFIAQLQPIPHILILVETG
jgi:hypothetical protein